MKKKWSIQKVRYCLDDFLQQLEEWIPQDVERVYAVLDNLSMHRAVDVLLFNLAYPRWEFVFQPT